MKTKAFIIALYLFLGSLSATAQQANFNGTGTAPDFTLTDMNGNIHNLYSYLDSGKTVVLKLMSVFCGACGMHAAPTENIWNNLGPNGSNEIMVMGLEINANSDSLDCLNYINNHNLTHPLINNVSSLGLGYSVNYTPTYYVVYPDYSYTPICYSACTYNTGPNSIENTLANLINSWSPPVTDLIISEYSEGSSYNKYVEIYNGTAYDVDLSHITDIVIESGTRNGTTMASAEGSCHDYVYIVVDESRFRWAETSERIFTMYHEFGHDVFNASHDGGGLMAPNVRELDYKLFQTEVSDFFNKIDFVEWDEETCERIREITEPYPG